MKNITTATYLAFVLSTATLLNACKSTTNKTNEADSTNHVIKPGKISKRTQDGCYMLLSGDQMRDTVYVQLHVQNDKVTGRMVSEIYEKDARRGTLAGTMQANKTIQAVWTFTQEGVTDTMAVAFALSHAGLMQKPIKSNATTGRMYTDMAAPYSIELKPADCNK